MSPTAKEYLARGHIQVHVDANMGPSDGVVSDEVFALFIAWPHKHADVINVARQVNQAELVCVAHYQQVVLADSKIVNIVHVHVSYVLDIPGQCIKHLGLAIPLDNDAPLV